jgi:hypothetical protein
MGDDENNAIADKHASRYPGTGFRKKVWDAERTQIVLGCFTNFTCKQDLTVVAITGLSDWARDFGQELYGDFQPPATPSN